MAKTVKYTLAFLALVLVVFFSFDIKKLDTFKASQKTDVFNATDFATSFWSDSLPVCIARVPPLEEVESALNSDPRSAFAKYGFKLGISQTWYLWAKAFGTIEKVDAETITLRLSNGTSIKIATDFIYGNAIRDGSGKVDINRFVNMTDFNAVSVELNKLAKEKVASRIKSVATPGLEIEFTCATELNEEKPDLNQALWLPVSYKTSLEHGK